MHEPEDPHAANVQHVRGQILAHSQAKKIGFEEAALQLKVSVPMLAPYINEALASITSSLQNVRLFPNVVASEGYGQDQAWYLGAVPDGHWAKYFAMLQKSGADGLAALEEETHQITSLLASPHHPGSRRKGLVMGNVQSGKTRNFAGVIARAVDAGYKLVIVLSGLHNNLRDQTQARLDKDLFDEPGWYPLTNAASDFTAVTKPQELLINLDVLCAVVKKNSRRLHNLRAMLKQISPEVRRKSPILIIDDEADQATPNSQKAKDKISTINGALRDLWALVETGTYVGYTATPFANILIDPDLEQDLFPSDFITVIEPGAGYFGAERVFGIAEEVSDDGIVVSEGLNVVRKIPAADVAALKPPSDADLRKQFDPDLPGSLRAALSWFIVATAIRWARDQREHSSMLVHTTHYADPHFAMKGRIEAEILRLLKLAHSGDMSALRSAYDAEAACLTGETTEPLPSWSAVEVQLLDVLQHVRVIVDNGSKAADRLNYSTEHKQTVVAVGGGTLARGLTLEGLVVSYFTRTSNTYDTLLQMGRWFGYRSGYEDLPRLWVSPGLDEEYAFLARVEQDLREEIKSVASSEFTPKEVGVKVRTHPGRLAVTSAAKLASAKVVQLGLSGVASQTFILDGSSEALVRGNFDAVEALLEGVSLTTVNWAPAKLMATGVSGIRVAQFLKSFKAHEKQKWLMDAENQSQTRDWVEKWAPGEVWNVMLAGRSAGQGDQPLSIAGESVYPLRRAPLSGSSPEHINLKAVMSQTDRIADIEPSLFGSEPVKTDADRRRVRRKHGANRGLIVVYPLSPDATAEGNPERMSMPVDYPQLAFAIVFPVVNDEQGKEGTFVSVRAVPEETFEDEYEYEAPDDEEDEIA